MSENLDDRCESCHKTRREVLYGGGYSDHPVHVFAPAETPPATVGRARAALDALAEYDESRSELHLLRDLQRIDDEPEPAA